MDTIDEFARALVQRLNREASDWVGLVDRTSDGSITDPYFRAVSRLYHALDDDEKQTFLALVQHANADGAASAFAAIEGVSCMNGWDGDFRLTYDGADLTEGLLDSFIGAQDDEACLGRHASH